MKDRKWLYIRDQYTFLIISIVNITMTLSKLIENLVKWKFTFTNNSFSKKNLETKYKSSEFCLSFGCLVDYSSIPIKMDSKQNKCSMWCTILMKNVFNETFLTDLKCCRKEIMMHGWLSEKFFWESCIFVGTKTTAAFDNILNDEIKGIFCNIFILHSRLF